MPSNSATLTGAEVEALLRRSRSRSRPVFDYSSTYLGATSVQPVTSSESVSQEEFEMATVSDVFGQSYPTESIEGHPLVVGKNRVGVEIELEDVRMTFPASRYWRVERDGSLRNNGVEFVFRGPMGGKDLYTALVEVDTFLHEASPDGSWRCSTHVHLDVRDMTADQLKNMFLTYLVYEQLLFNCSGEERYKNNFCPALGFAQQMLKVLSDNWYKNDRQFMNGIVGGWEKYSAMNLCPMSGYGSVEFRMSGAKWCKGHLIKHCNRLLSLKEFAMNWTGTQEELILHLVQCDPREVIKKGLPKDFDIDSAILEFGAKLAFDVLRMSRMRQKSQELLRAQLSSDGEQVFEVGRVQNQPALDDIFNYLRGSSGFSELSWLEGRSEFPEHMSFTQLADMVYHCGASKNWMLPRDLRPAFDEFYREYARLQDNE